MSITYHESLQRGPRAMSRLKETRIAICGAGALGANLAESLARCGAGHLRLVDRDRVEERNLSTQPYALDDIGSHKARALAYSLYRAVGLEALALTQELTLRNAAKLLRDSDLVIDCFDNSVAREAVARHCHDAHVPCLHVGLAAGYAEVLWDEVYRVPSDAQDDICDYPLARNLVTLTVAVAAETVFVALSTGERSNWTVTLGDLSVQPYL